VKIDIDDLKADFRRARLGMQQFPPHPITTIGSIDLEKIVNAVNTVLEPELSGEEGAIVALAREQYALPSDDDIEIDDKPMLAKTERGTWVAAWVWIPKETT